MDGIINLIDLDPGVDPSPRIDMSGSGALRTLKVRAVGNYILDYILTELREICQILPLR